MALGFVGSSCYTDPASAIGSEFGGRASLSSLALSKQRMHIYSGCMCGDESGKEYGHLWRQLMVRGRKINVCVKWL